MNSQPIDNLKHLVSKSNEYMKEFSSAFTSNHSKATTIISVIAIFIPLYFNVVDGEKGTSILMLISFIPVSLIIISLYYALTVIIPKKLPYGFKIDSFEKLVKESLEKNLGYELGVNVKSLRIAEKVIEKQGRKLKLSIVFLTISLLLSVLLIFFIKMNF